MTMPTQKHTRVEGDHLLVVLPKGTKFEWAALDARNGATIDSGHTDTESEGWDAARKAAGLDPQAA